MRDFLLLFASFAVLNVDSFQPRRQVNHPTRRHDDHRRSIRSSSSYRQHHTWPLASLSDPKLDVNNNGLTAIIIFDVDTPAAQNDLVQQIQDFSRLVRHEPGFVSASIHKSIDGQKVANYAQWESQAALDAFRNNQALRDAARFLNQYGPPDSRTYEIFAWKDKTTTTTNGAATIRHGPIVHFAEFDVYHADLQPQMVQLAQEHLGPAMEQEGLLSATFHQSHDGMKVINYGQWENAEAIENLKRQPGFSTTDSTSKPYWDDVAVNEHHLYELVSIVRKEEEEEEEP